MTRTIKKIVRTIFRFINCFIEPPRFSNPHLDDFEQLTILKREDE